MKKIPPNQLRQNKLLVILGFLIIIGSFIVWVLKAIPYHKIGLDIPQNIQDIKMYGRFIGLSLIAFYFVLNEINIKLKYLFFCWVFIFFIGLLFIYGVNDILIKIDKLLNTGDYFDKLLNGIFMLKCLILSFIICFILYLLSLRKK